MTPEAAQEFPEALRQLGDGLPAVLLPYQQRLLATTAVSQVTICEKSRRIGMTWAIGADAVLSAGAARTAGGMDVLYIGYNLDMAREFIDVCAMWAKAFMPAASAVEEFLFADKDEAGADRQIKAFRIAFASGFEIVALTSNPRSLRGRQGYLIFDEAAFHDDLDGMMKAGLAFLMWGGKILVISTHNGETNPFAGLVDDSRAGRKPYAVQRVTFDDAIADGLYERVAMMLEAHGQAVDPKATWIQKIRDFYGRDAEEELDVIPAQGTGTVLAGSLIELRMDPELPVVRLDRPDSFVEEPLRHRRAEILDWCESELEPLLRDLSPKRQSYLGMDFGRHADLSVIWPLLVEQDLTRRPPFVVELSNIPFEQQKEILIFIGRRLPRLTKGALDAGGNGASLAEAAADEFGHSVIEQVKLSTSWYMENMPRFVAAFEDGTVVLPRDADLLNDHRMLQRVAGVIRVPDARADDLKAKGKKRHGDSAIAHALAHYATLSEAGPFDYRTLGDARPSRAPADDFFVPGGAGGALDYFRM